MIVPANFIDTAQLSSGVRGSRSLAIYQIDSTMRAMSAAYRDLLNAMIQHLLVRKNRGERFVSARREILLAATQARPTASSPSKDRPSATGSALAAPLSRSAPPAAPLIETTNSPAPAPIVPREPVAPGLPPAPGKAEAMRDLRERALVCVKCPHLATSRKNVVFGVGDIDAQLMFVGEAPGADEDVQGEPFVGAAGQLLTRIIQTMGLSRQTVYIANILKCRPDMPGQSTGNRKPTLEEMKTCIPYLHSQIDLIRPRALVGLGATAVEGLLGKTEGITRLRGHWREYRGIPLMPTFHPSYLLRNQALSEKRKVWEDMLQVMERLGLPVGEKQRGYFLKS